MICIARMSLNKTEVIKEENNGVNYIKSIIDMSEDFYKMNTHYVMDGFRSHWKLTRPSLVPF